MPWPNRYIGNPILTGMLNLLFHARVSDAHCGLRAIRRDVIPQLELSATGMEFASEMVIKAGKRLCASTRSRSTTTRASATRSSRASATRGVMCASCSSTARRFSS